MGDVSKRKRLQAPMDNALRTFDDADANASFSTHEVAALLGISYSTMRRILKRGALPYWMAGGQLRIRKADVLRFMREQTRGRDLAPVTPLRHHRKRS
jgi:excisionase family DNA binding protein